MSSHINYEKERRLSFAIRLKGYFRTPFLCPIIFFSKQSSVVNGRLVSSYNLFLLENPCYGDKNIPWTFFFLFYSFYRIYKILATSHCINNIKGQFRIEVADKINYFYYTNKISC